MTVSPSVSIGALSCFSELSSSAGEGLLDSCTLSAEDDGALAAGVGMGCVGWETDGGSVPSKSICGASSMSIGTGVGGNKVGGNGEE